MLPTRYLGEAEELCGEIALVGGGQLVARDTAAGLLARYAARSLTEVYMKTVGGGRLNGGDPETTALEEAR